MSETLQEKVWSGGFGREYTDRNPQTPQDYDELYMARYGITRTEMNQRFLEGIDRRVRILEVGTNVGAQPSLLEKLGFRNLYGIELQKYAVATGRKLHPGVTFIQGSGFSLPFVDGAFDMIFTSGVLIHIHPDNLPRIIDEVHRCTRRWIWGFEYYSDSLREISYRGKANLLWKADYAGIMLKRHPDLREVRREYHPYRESDDVDCMFLLEKMERG